MSQETSSAPSQDEMLPRWRPAAPRLPVASQYVLADLLRFDDADFIDNAYAVLLHRPADASGRAGYLEALRGGSKDKIEILGSLRFSDEGRRCDTRVDGLLVPYKLHRWRRRRFIGPILGFMMAVVHLPRLVLHLQALEARAARESQELGTLLNALGTVVQRKIDRVDDEVGPRAHGIVEAGFRAFAGALDGQPAGSDLPLHDRSTHQPARDAGVVNVRGRPGVDPVAFRAQALASLAGGSVQRGAQSQEVSGDVPSQSSASTQAAATVASVVDRQGRDLRRDIGEALAATARTTEGLERDALITRRDMLQLQRRLERLVPQSVQVSTEASLQPPPAPGVRLETHALDSFYVGLEDNFRGSRDLVAKRCAGYLPMIRLALERTQGGVVLDIGCGRGEWLGLLRDNGIAAKGIDLNEMMVLECRAAGFDVQEAEAISQLRTMEGDSITAVTGMHIVEHIPFDSVIALFDEIFRVLKPGGVAVFETPNPENFDVAACWFYMDPTHLHPLPPPLLEYTARSRGFGAVEIMRLTEYRPVVEAPDVQDSGQPDFLALQWLLARSRERLGVAPDYAVVAWKDAGQGGG